MLSRNSKIRIAITGSSGLIGKEVQKILQSNFDLILIDKALKRDIVKDEILELLDKKKPNVVVHCAAHPGGISNIFPNENVRVNCVGSMNIISWCQKNKSKLIFTSSSSVYGDQSSFNINENYFIKPQNIYSVNKIAVENYIKVLAKIKNFPWTILRLFPTYGIGHKPSLYQGIVNVMFTQIKNSKNIIVKGSLHRKRDLLYSKDAALAIVKCIKNSKANYNIFNVGTGIATSVKKIIDEIINVFGYSKNNYDIIVKNRDYGDPYVSISNSKLIKKKINFRPFFDFKNGLKDMLNNI